MCCYSKIYFAHCTVCSLMCCYILKYILHILLALCDSSMKYIFRNVRLYGSSMRCIDMKNFLWWQLLFGDFLWWQLLCCGFSHRIYSWQILILVVISGIKKVENILILLIMTSTLHCHRMYIIKTRRNSMLKV